MVEEDNPGYHTIDKPSKGEWVFMIKVITQTSKDLNSYNVT